MYWLFRDRRQAGEALGRYLLEYGWSKSRPQWVLGLARGGVAVAKPVADALGLPLEVLVVRKIGAPGNTEFGVGAICEDGQPLLSRATLELLNLKPEDLAGTIEARQKELVEKIRSYRGSPLLWNPPPAWVAVVDDGLATGVSAEAAVRFLRRQGIQRVSLAVPVASAETVSRLKNPGILYDEILTLEAITDLGSIGAWYEDFSPVEDAAVIALLQKNRAA